jgi:hypothetical protein
VFATITGSQAVNVEPLLVVNGFGSPATAGVPGGVTVTAKDGSFDSSIVKRGDSFSYEFTTAGTYEVACTSHPAMVGKVVVSAEAATSAPAPAKGPLVDLPGKAAVPARASGSSLAILLGLSAVLVVLVAAASAAVVMLGAKRGVQ